MLERLFNFLKNLFGEDVVVMIVYGDKVTTPGLSVVFSESQTSTIRDLEGTTYMQTGTFVVQIWDDNLEKVEIQKRRLQEAMEGTEFQIQNMRPVRTDGNRRKWHRDIEIQVMEDF